MPDPPKNVLEFLEELRRIAEWGLSYTTDPYDVERYTRLLELASIEYGKLSGLPKDLLMDRFKQELGGNITPKIGLDAAIFDEEGQLLLLRRDDDGLWSVPGGWAELGESPQESIRREVLEETTLDVDVRDLIGVYHRMPGEYGQPHTSYHLLFHCVVQSGTPQTTAEALEIGYFNREAIHDWHRDMAKVTAMARDYWNEHLAAPALEKGLYVGIDGCKVGWLFFALSRNGDVEFGVEAHFDSIWKRWRHAEALFVDVPIGLLDEGSSERRCDLEARALLGSGRASSVFPVPCRGALRAQSYREASGINRVKLGRGLSKQTWNICSKIREVDRLLQDETTARKAVQEIHPEVLFSVLNGGVAMQHNKRTAAGFEERLKVLHHHYPDAGRVVRDALDRYSRGQVARDDILDALAAAVTGLASVGPWTSIPEHPDLDATGLPMRMVIPSR